MTTPLLHTRTRNPYGTIGQKASSTNPHSGINPHAPEKRGDWVMRAKCRDVDPDSLFVTGAEQRQAAEICSFCPVILQCRADALDNKVEFGVWGGLTERQRRAILRKNPHVTNWYEYLSNGGELIGL